MTRCFFRCLFDWVDVQKKYCCVETQKKKLLVANMMHFFLKFLFCLEKKRR
jgi:hypothetical protein